ncbi:MAG: hypothetical protein JWN04_1244 [Myxococcaceae bacterium]|nr:hypothetical protein [Myxococcaceae bacterium]
MNRQSLLAIDDESLDLVAGGADRGIVEGAIALDRYAVSKGISVGVVATNIGVSLSVVAGNEATALGQAVLGGLLETSAR